MDGTKAQFAQDQAPADEINLRQYLQTLVRWWRLILLCAILGAAAALLFSFMRERSYASTATVAIVRSATIVNFDPKIRTVSNTDPTASLDQASFRKALTTIANSADLATTVFAALKPQLDPAIQDAEMLQARMEITNDGDMIRIAARARSPEQATLLANVWAQEYVQRANQVYGDNYVSLQAQNQQIESARADRDAKQEAVVAYLRDNPTEKLRQQMNEKQLIVSDLLQSKKQAIQSVITETQQIQLRLLNDYLDAFADTRSTVFTEQVQTRLQNLRDLYALDLKLQHLSANAQALRARLSQSSSVQPGNDLALNLLETSAFTTSADLPIDLQVSMNQLGSGRTPAEQQQALDVLVAELAKQRAQIQTEIQATSKALLSDADYAYLETSAPNEPSPLSNAIQRQRQALLDLQGLDELVAYKPADGAVSTALEQLASEINVLSAQLEVERAKKAQLEFARDLAQTTYETLSNKAAESQVTQGAAGSVVRISTNAVEPTLPTSRNLLLTLGLGIMVGLLIGSATAFALEYLGASRMDMYQVAQVFGAPPLAALPRWDSDANPETLPASVREALRALRYHVFEQHKARVITVTSAWQGEGVTTLAAHLAAVAAQGGLNTLLLDANLRQPAVHSQFKLELEPGLTNLLNADAETKVELASYARVVNPNLTVLTVGALQADPAALFQRQTFALLIQHLREKFDALILDTPPLHGTIDAVEIARVADGTLLVVDGAHTTRAAVIQAQTALTAAGLPILGVALNRIGRVTSKAARASSADAAPARTRWADLQTRFIDLVGPRSGT